MPHPLDQLLLPSPLQPLHVLPHLDLWIKRDDLIHPIVAGNKWRKLAGFFAQLTQPTTVLTFGGAHSNHLAASAACIVAHGHQGIFVIRGQELTPQSSDVLRYCHGQGMQLRFISRHAYRILRQQHWQPDKQDQLNWHLPDNFCVLPEGGKGPHNQTGCAQLWQEIQDQCNPAHIWLATGTGATCQGLLHAMPEYSATQVTAVSAVKGAQQEQQETQAIAQKKGILLHWIDETVFGGFAKANQQLIHQQQEFQKNTGIPIDAVYNAKLWWHLTQHSGQHSGQHSDQGQHQGQHQAQINGTIVWIHTGGFRQQHANLTEAP